MGPDVLYSESSGNLGGGRDGTAKSRPSSSGLKTDGLDGWEHCFARLVLLLGAAFISGRVDLQIAGRLSVNYI